MMYVQLHLHERKLIPIGSMSVVDGHAYCTDNIHSDSLAEWWFCLIGLRSPSANLLAYTKLVNLTGYSHNKKSPAA